MKINSFTYGVLSGVSISFGSTLLGFATAGGRIGIGICGAIFSALGIFIIIVAPKVR